MGINFDIQAHRMGLVRSSGGRLWVGGVRLDAG